MTDLASVLSGGKAGLSRALTQAETRMRDPAVLSLLDEAFAAPRGVAIGLTGPPGAGKSSLINALIKPIRARGLRLGIIAVDPSSRRSGGALLGDRTRFSHDPDDEGVFVRSMAARDRLGGVAEITYPAMILMRAACDLVLVETVGIGQSETEIAELADLTVLCAQPGAGDALQFMKAGVMEVPDIVLVTKADMTALAHRTVSDLKGALSITDADGRAPQVMAVSSETGEGVNEALDLMLADDLGNRSDRRLSQGRAWLTSQIRSDFGRFGLAQVAEDIASRQHMLFSFRAVLDAGLQRSLMQTTITF